MEGKTQETAAAAAEMSVRSARKWEQGPLPSEVRKPRWWRTRPDPYAEVWEQDVVPLLEADRKGELQAKTIFEELVERYPGRFQPGQRRTLERRVRDWRAVSGPEKEVYFPQEHPPGREGVFDFTRAKKLEVRIAGELLVHLLFVFKLSCSGWTWVQVAFGETYEALVEGLQGALWALGGVPEIVRHDNLSAATHELKRSGGRSLTRRFQGVLDHYGLDSTRIRPGEAHENGVAEKGNDLVKQALTQALVLRVSRDFASVAHYQAFVNEVIDRAINRPQAAALAVEKSYLQALPSARVPTYTTYRPKVRRWSTLRIGNRGYSVPSRLIGHEVEVRQHANHLEVYYRGRRVETVPRLRGDRVVRIDYRHVIWSLVRKPGAFARYRFREELFPSLVFRRAYDALRRWRGERADVEYVRILHLAASTLEADVEQALSLLLEAGERFDYAVVKELAKPEPVTVPTVHIPEPDLSVYDARYLGVGR
ncbi:MAG: IS21 family transposase [bacterium]|nr:IS21 family transposase [bacterium]